MNNKKQTIGRIKAAQQRKVWIESQGLNPQQSQKRRDFSLKVFVMTLEEVNAALLQYPAKRFKFHNAVLMSKLEELTKTNSD